MFFDKIKEFLETHRKIIYQIISFVSLYIVGVLSGIFFYHGVGESDFPQKRQQNYNTKSSVEQTEPKTTTNAKPASTVAVNDIECVVKGNISGKNKTYHIQGGSFYERTTAEQCFNTEEEAIAAGFVKSSR